MSVSSVSGGTRTGRLDSLTGLRFIAALMVFVYHGTVLSVFADTTVQKGYSSVVDNAGAMGVSFFFVLSGFVLTWSARPSDRLRRFWRRRAVKVLPNHVVAYVIALVLLLAAGETIRVGSALATLFLVHSWIPDPHFVATSINGVTWSLSVEVVCYLLFPLVLPLINKIRENRLWLSYAGVVALALLVPVVALTLLPGQPPSPFAPDTSWPQMWFTHFFPLARGLEFLAGMVMARIVLSGRWINMGVAPAVLLAGLVYVVSLQLPTIYGFASLYPLPLSLLIAAAATADVRGHRSWLSSRPMVWLGDLSYAFFLLHLFVMFNLHAATGGEWAAIGTYQRQSWSTPVALLFLLGELLVCILLARLMYRLVEAPAMRRWASPRRREPDAAPVASGGRRPDPAADPEPLPPPIRSEDTRPEIAAGSPPAN
ncbi:acyltransferase family protein [Micromonospora sp. CPCC 205561]|uniref:acyltransferase family protein n=1 Tax=Micromonospora sp. CPCC 205561 TaxID=3122407 RepID=UPI002FF06206